MTALSSEPRVVIVLTTIRSCEELLAGLIANFETFDRLGKNGPDVVVIPDRKTPAKTYEEVRVARAAGMNVCCPSVAEQELFLEKICCSPNFIPYDSDNRRNVGYLMALSEAYDEVRSADVIISIDDDNFIPGNDGAPIDWIGAHLDALNGVDCNGSPLYVERVETVGEDQTMFRDGHACWNCCEALHLDTDAAVYPRGYPYARRGNSTRYTGPAMLGDKPVSVHAGLWSGDPDVDAVTRLAINPVSYGLEHHFKTQRAILGERVWCPINSQNTSMTRNAAFAYWYARMISAPEARAFGGVRIDRFGDILAGYFLLKCAKACGHSASFGQPLLEHRRAKHDLFDDLAVEAPGLRLLEDLFPKLVAADIGSHKTHLDAYDALIAWLWWWYATGESDFLRETSLRMKRWSRVVRQFA